MTSILSRTTRALCLFALLLGLSFFPTPLLGADFQVQSETFFRAFESGVAGDDEQVLPIYQSLKLVSDDFALEGLSFHAYGWGRHEAADSDHFNDQSEGELLYAYLDYRTDDSPIRARLGRQYIFSGVANDSIDGLWLKGTLNGYLSASVYAGQPVGLSTTNDRSGDSIYGGRLAHKNKNRYEIGLSYQSSENDGDTAEHLLGVDLAADLPLNAIFYGYSTVNLETDDWAEHSYEINIYLNSFTVRPFFEHYLYEDYFNTGANATNPFKLLALSGDELTTFGVDASWRQSAAFTFGGKIKSYSYDQNLTSRFISLTTTWHSETTELTQVGAEVGYMDGEAANNDYLLLRCYGFIDQTGDRFWLDFFSGDITYVLYDRDIHGRQYSLFTSLGMGKKFYNDQITTRLSGDYSQDPYFDDNLQVLLSVSFSFDFSM